MLLHRDVLTDVLMMVYPSLQACLCPSTPTHLHLAVVPIAIGRHESPEILSKLKYCVNAYVVCVCVCVCVCACVRVRVCVREQCLSVR